MKLLQKSFNNPTPIQSQAWPIAMSGLDMVGIAETGSGKTLSFMVPAIEQILRNRLRAKSRAASGASAGPLALIMSPTRELAIQLIDASLEFLEAYEIRNAFVYGGVPIATQIERCRDGVELIVACPGRLADLMNRREVNLKRLIYFVLDEADRLLDMNFSRDILNILKYANPEHQTLLWSATWPQKTREFAKCVFSPERSPIFVKIGTEGECAGTRINHQFIFVRVRMTRCIGLLEIDSRLEETLMNN